MTPLVSVIIATRNRPRLLSLALDSVAAQDVVAEVAVEVVVVNDGGVDVGAEVLPREVQGIMPQLVTLAGHLGLPAARNAGIERSRGEYLAFLDDDDIFLPNHLRTALCAFERSGCDGVYTACAISPMRLSHEQALPAGLVTTGHAFDADLLSVANFIPVHSMVLRRPWSKGARFDPGLPALEDWDMWLRLDREVGCRFRHVPDPTVVYHRIPGQVSMSGAAVGDPTVLAEFGATAQRLWRRWRPRSSRAGRFRAYVGVMYWHALACLAAGRRISDLYFHRSIGLIADVWDGMEDEDGLIDRIRQVVETEDRADVS